ncbi:MAG: AAA family ATPase [Candidatus Kapabacteria bacterium]|nr:AAA family ATPase [Candidatus Kapabacteria bacterium]
MSLFIEREELEILRKKLDDAVKNGIGSVVFISGEPGSGKTTLIEQFLKECDSYYEQNILTASSRCLDMDGVSRGFLPWKEILIELDADKAAGKDEEKKNNFKKVIKVIFDDAGPEWIQSIDVIGDIAAAALTTAKAISKTDTIDVATGEVKKLSFAERLKNAFDYSAGAWLGAIPMVGGLFEAIFKTSQKLAENEQQTFLKSQEDFFWLVSKKLRDMAKENPIVIFLDDLQWADLSSINLLFYLARNIKDRTYPLIIIGSYRYECLKEGRFNPIKGTIEQHPLLEKINNLIRYSALEEIQLSLFNKAQIRDLINITFKNNDFTESFAADLYNLTKGNPLFVDETLKNLQENFFIYQDSNKVFKLRRKFTINEIPKTIAAVLNDRFLRLNDDMQLFLQVASVQGERFSLEIISKILGENLVKIEKTNANLSDIHKMVQKSDVIDESFREYYEFSNNLLQKYVYESLNADFRLSLHRKVANAYREYQTEDGLKNYAYHLGVATKIFDQNGQITDKIANISTDDVNEIINAYKKLSNNYIKSFRLEEANIICHNIVRLSGLINDIEAEIEYTNVIGKGLKLSGKWNDAEKYYKSAYEKSNLIKNSELSQQVTENYISFLELKARSFEKSNKLNESINIYSDALKILNPLPFGLMEARLTKQLLWLFMITGKANQIKKLIDETLNKAKSTDLYDEFYEQILSLISKGIDFNSTIGDGRNNLKLNQILSTLRNTYK